MHFRFAVMVTDLGIMRSGNEVGFQLFPIRPQLAELQPVVADYTRIGRSAGEILVGKVINDAFEIAFKIESVKGNVESIGPPPSIARVERAATALLVRGA